MPSRSLGRFELAAIVVAALLSLLFHLRLPWQLPSEADHRAAAEHIARGAREGDVVLLHPWWTERARLFAPKHLPVVGYLGSDGDALADHPRIWLLSQPDLPRAGRADFDAKFLPGRKPEDRPAKFGRIEVALFENGRHRPALWRATTSLRAAEAPIAWHEVRFAPKRCLTVALAKRGTAEIALPPLVAGAELTLEAGFIWDSAFRGGSPVEVQLELEGAPPLSLTLAPRREGLSERTLAPFPGAPSGKLLIRTAHPANREVCVDVTVRGSRR